MNQIEVLFHGWAMAQPLFSFLSTSLGFFCYSEPFGHPTIFLPSVLTTYIGFDRLKSTLELLCAIVGILSSVFLFFYIHFQHRKMRELDDRPHSKRISQKRYSWTVDEVNFCLVPLGIGVTFAVIYLMFG